MKGRMIRKQRNRNDAVFVYGFNDSRVNHFEKMAPLAIRRRIERSNARSDNA